jgi:TM2 domain-containing membrane protein YozV
MSKVIKYLPELEDEEQLYVAQLMKSMTEEQAEYFSRVYRERRKDPTVTLLAILAGFLGIAGGGRFYLNEIGMGVLYLLTGGLCVIGTIIDLIRHRKMTRKYNEKKADEASAIIRGAFPTPTAPGLLSE